MLAALGTRLLLALVVACGAQSSSRATMPAPSFVEESPDLAPADGEPGDAVPPMDSTVTGQPEQYEPPPEEPAQPESVPVPPPAPPPEPTQLTAAEIADIKALLIQASIDAYDGSCPCPYHEARDGRSCGRRSAYSRAGGEEPLCYPEDVSDEMVAEYWVSQR
jgi:hypothetical protein